MYDYDNDLLLKVIRYNHDRYISYKNNLEFTRIPEYEKILSARYMKCSRIKRRLIYLLSRSKYVWFCTFTFSNEYINKCDRTQRDLIKNVIGQKDFKYILNIDFGSKTERKHFHCILGTDIDLDINSLIQTQYPCYCLAIPVKKYENDFIRLTKYINKLVNHCIKSSTKNFRVVYNFKGYDDLCPDSYSKWILYTHDYLNLFPEC